MDKPEGIQINKNLFIRPNLYDPRRGLILDYVEILHGTSQHISINIKNIDDVITYLQYYKLWLETDG